MLQFTHFINVYANLLSAWGLILARTRLCIEWHRVLAWLHDRLSESPPPAASNAARQVLVFSPSDWSDRRQRQAAFLSHEKTLSNLMTALAFPRPSVSLEVVPPSSLTRKHHRARPQKVGVPLHVLSTTATNQTLSSSQRRLSAVCVVCNVTARGVVVACPVCHHGGHVEHIAAWWYRCQLRKQQQQQQSPPSFSPSLPRVQHQQQRSPLVCPAQDCNCLCPHAEKLVLPLA